MITFLRVIFRTALAIGGVSAVTGLWLWWRIRRAARAGDDSAIAYGAVLGPISMVAFLALFLGGGAGLWLAAVLPDPVERATVGFVSVVVLVPDLALIARMDRTAGADRRDVRQAFRWVNLEEAVALLRAGSVSTFRYGKDGLMDRRLFRGRRTGIKLSDFGRVQDLWVEPAKRAILEPLAREIRERTGRPRFVVDDRWDRPS